MYIYHILFHSLLLSSFSLLPSPFSLLPSPFSLLPSPFSLLPSPFSLLPSPFSSFLFSCLLAFRSHAGRISLLLVPRGLGLMARQMQQGVPIKKITVWKIKDSS